MWETSLAFEKEFDAATFVVDTVATIGWSITGTPEYEENWLGWMGGLVTTDFGLMGITEFLAIIGIFFWLFLYLSNVIVEPLINLYWLTSFTSIVSSDSLLGILSFCSEVSLSLSPSSDPLPGINLICVV